MDKKELNKKIEEIVEKAKEKIIEKEKKSGGKNASNFSYVLIKQNSKIRLNTENKTYMPNEIYWSYASRCFSLAIFLANEIALMYKDDPSIKGVSLGNFLITDIKKARAIEKRYKQVYFQFGIKPLKEKSK